MCTRTAKGYLMNDGTLVPFDFNVENVHPKHIAELNNNTASVWDILITQKTIVDAIEAKLGNHNNSCPLNKPFIEEMIKEEIKKQPKIVWTKTKKILAIILGGIMGLTAIINTIIAFKELAK